MEKEIEIINKILICKVCGFVPEQKIEKPDKPPIPVKYICNKCKKKNKI